MTTIPEGSVCLAVGLDNTPGVDLGPVISQTAHDLLGALPVTDKKLVLIMAICAEDGTALG